MFNIGPVELMVVLVLALIVFGPAKLPELMASVGTAIREFQRASRELTEVFQETQQEFESALDVDDAPTSAPAEAEPVGYQVPAEETTITPPETVVVSQQPEEFETAAAMVDPVEPFPVPAMPEPEPVAAVAAVADAPKPRRPRRRKADADAATAGEAPPVAEAAPVAGLDAAPVAELTTNVAAAEPPATAPAEEAGLVAPAPAGEIATSEPVANGAEPYAAPVEPPVNGAGSPPSPRRRRRDTLAATAPEESP